VKATGSILDMLGLEEEEYIKGASIGIDKRESYILFGRG
jgi:hypothetical protein